MAKEIERKFLVNQPKLNCDVHSVLLSRVTMQQGYLGNYKNHVLRVRKEVHDTGRLVPKLFLTYKGPNTGIERTEIECRLPVFLSKFLLGLCDKVLRKTRKVFRHRKDRTVWEVDYFENLPGKHKDLVIAEVELQYAEQPLELPDWVDKEVSDDPQYYNSSLIDSIE
jgi:adenylate cyclase